MARISKEVIERVKREADILGEVRSLGVNLKRCGDGNEYRGLCPFPEHREKVPSFYVNAVKNCYFCHGCGRKGNVIDVVMFFDRLSFREALEKLARKANVDMAMNQTTMSTLPGGEK